MKTDRNDRNDRKQEFSKSKVASKLKSPSKDVNRSLSKTRRENIKKTKP